MMSYRSVLLGALLALPLLLPGFQAGATEAGWALLRGGGQVVLINEAYSLATGRHGADDIGNCATQQTLSERGRSQAGRIGALFYARSAPVDLVLTSRHCRTQETAAIAFRDSTIEIFEPLNEYVPDAEHDDEQIEAAIERIREFRGSRNLRVVAPARNIEALTGSRAPPGEVILLSRSAEKRGVAARRTFN